MDNEIRSFIAIELTEDTRRALARVQDSIKRPEFNFVKWVSPKGIHLTLKFLGNIKQQQVNAIIAAIKNGCQGYSSLDLQINGLGAFPNLRIPRVLWAGITGDIDTLINLQRRIDTNLVPLGFTEEKRPFSPHITLARLNDNASPQEKLAQGKIVEQQVHASISTVHVQGVSLMRSTLLPTGAIYNQLARIELKG